MKILVLYDGTLQAKNALKYGIHKAREKDGEVVALHVFDRSRFVDYDAGPKAEELARVEAARHLEDARKIVSETAAGVQTRILSVEGDVEQLTVRYAVDEQAEVILAPPRYRGMAKSAPCPVYPIPGTILVPVDNTETPDLSIEKIREEVAMTGSKVMLLGVVPVHLYSREEKRELEKVKKDTAQEMKRLRKALSGSGIESSEVLRSGYPDEEILKAAEENSVSLIILPSGGATPSELSKAAVILAGESDRVKWPVMLVSPSGAA